MKNFVILPFIFLLWSVPMAQAKVFMTVKEALDVQFPTNDQWTVTTETKYLTAEQIQKAKDLSHLEDRKSVV